MSRIVTYFAEKFVLHVVDNLLYVSISYPCDRSLNTVIDDVTNNVTPRIFNTNLYIVVLLLHSNLI